jgi:hypothetical protein
MHTAVKVAKQGLELVSKMVSRRIWTLYIYERVRVHLIMVAPK